MKLVELEAVLQNAQIADIVFLGFLDHSEQPARFCALFDAVYVELDGVFLEIATIGDTGRANIGIVAEPRLRAELDDDMTLAITSVRQQILRDPDATNALCGLSLWGVVEAEDQLSCAALCIHLENGQRVFVDPFNYFGIRIGGDELKALWVASTPGGGSSQTDVTLRRAQTADT